MGLMYILFQFNFSCGSGSCWCSWWCCMRSSSGITWLDLRSDTHFNNDSQGFEGISVVFWIFVRKRVIIIKDRFG